MNELKLQFADDSTTRMTVGPAARAALRDEQLQRLLDELTALRAHLDGIDAVRDADGTLGDALGRDELEQLGTTLATAGGIVDALWWLGRADDDEVST